MKNLIRALAKGLFCTARFVAFFFYDREETFGLRGVTSIAGCVWGSTLDGG